MVGTPHLYTMVGPTREVRTYMLCCCESSCQYMMYVCVCTYVHTYVRMYVSTYVSRVDSQWRLALYKHKDLHYVCPVPLLSPLPLCSLAHIHTHTSLNHLTSTSPAAVSGPSAQVSLLLPGRHAGRLPAPVRQRQDIQHGGITDMC